PYRPWRVGKDALPAAQTADGPSADRAWVETFSGHLLQVWVQQLGEGNLRPESAAQTLQTDQDSKQQREVAGEGQPVAVHDLHARVGCADHVEIGDVAAEVAVEPGPELAGAGRGKAADVAEVKDGQVLPVGQQKVPRVRIGVVDAVPKHHLQVDV